MSDYILHVIIMMKWICSSCRGSVFIEFQHLTRWLLPGDPSLSEKGENLTDALAASFVASAVLSAFTAYVLILCSSGQTGVISTETVIIYYQNNFDNDDDYNETIMK